jgi:hypothetical protein
MKKVFVLTIVICITIFSISCVTTSHETKLQEMNAKLMSQSDLETLFQNEIIFDYQTNKSHGTTTYKPDGTCAVVGSGFSDTGKYWIENGQYCSTWDTYRTSVQCTKWYKTGENKFEQVLLNGTYNSKMVLK